MERGWFICEDKQKIMPNQIAVVGMVEDVKQKVGSSYVTQKGAQYCSVLSAVNERRNYERMDRSGACHSGKT